MGEAGKMARPWRALAFVFASHADVRLTLNGSAKIRWRQPISQIFSFLKEGREELAQPLNLNTLKLAVIFFFLKVKGLHNNSTFNQPLMGIFKHFRNVGE